MRGVNNWIKSRMGLSFAMMAIEYDGSRLWAGVRMMRLVISSQLSICEFNEIREGAISSLHKSSCTCLNSFCKAHLTCRFQIDGVGTRGEVAEVHTGVGRYPTTWASLTPLPMNLNWIQQATEPQLYYNHPPDINRTAQGHRTTGKMSKVHTSLPFDPTFF